MRLLATLFLSIFLVSACTYTQKIRDGKTAYERKQYQVALQLLQKDYQKSKTRVEKGQLAFLIGQSLKETGKSSQSTDWFRIAYDNQYGVEALKEYAFSLKTSQQYEEAIQAFKELGIEIGSPYEYRKEIAACETALGWLKKPTYEYQVRPAPFNSNRADYAPMVYENNQLVFTSDRPAATGDDAYLWTGNDFSDLFVVDLQSQAVSPFDQTLNSTFNDGTAAFNREYDEVFFTRCFSGEKFQDNFCKLMVSKRNGDTWSVPAMLPFVEDNVNYGHPALSDDGQKLFFSSNHPDGWGGYDIYYATRTADGWSAPTLLGRSINTPRDEQFPYLDADTLYFASDGQSGMGGLDIFRTYQLSDGNWSPAYNLKPPINSGADDFALILLDADPGADILQRGYFSSTREEGMGNDDIYYFEKTLPQVPPEEPLITTPTVTRMILEGYVLEKIFAEADNPNAPVLGRKPLPGAEVTIRYNRQSRTVTVGEDGFFSLELQEDTDYSFFATKEDYLNQEARFSTIGIAKDPSLEIQKYEVEIVLDKIFRNQEITLEEIYYDFDRSEIRDDAKPTLDKLARDLALNPDIRIQMGSHTDCRGNNRYNEELSQRRAQSAVDYLISKGIAPDRLFARGFGENVPAVDCVCNRCTEEEHQKNRRTTFAIIE